MAKKKNNKKKIDEINTSFNMKKSIKIIIITLVLLFGFYLLTIVILNTKSKSIDYNSSIRYDKILAGTTFNQNSSDYLVFFYDTKDSNSGNYAELVSKYKGKDNHLDIYTVDLNEGLNRKYINDKSNENVNSSKDLKINGATLIHIKDHKNVFYITSSFNEYLDSTINE